METYEEKLSDIANTAKWSIEEFDDFKRFERVIDDAAAKLKTMKKELEEGYVFGGQNPKGVFEMRSRNFQRH
jgi:lipid-binding SYLF domain-containing protein